MVEADDVFEDCLYTCGLFDDELVGNPNAALNLNGAVMSGTIPLDVLVRTSGEKRLSDFLTVQVCRETRIFFLDVLWPEFGEWDMVWILLAYQCEFTKNSERDIVTIDEGWKRRECFKRNLYESRISSCDPNRT